ncbi:hypothetical protein [Janthinobacterium sp. LB3P118]|uniref:hypothetical protein n=1 Tax=Janthinobacterium sp. LB3P118 TaxID=3424195 RepID=UPI003F239DDC
MRYWQVARRQAEGQLELVRALDLVAAIGHADVNAMAGAILKTAGAAGIFCRISPTATRAMTMHSTATRALSRPTGIQSNNVSILTRK